MAAMARAMARFLVMTRENSAAVETYAPRGCGAPSGGPGHPQPRATLGAPPLLSAGVGPPHACVGWAQACGSSCHVRPPEGRATRAGPAGPTDGKTGRVSGSPADGPG